MKDRIAFAAALAGHLRKGGEYSIGGPSEGRIIHTETRFKLGRTRVDDDLSLLIRVSTVARSGKSHEGRWTWCDWTLEDLAALHDEISGDDTAESTDLQVADMADEIVAKVASLADGREIVLGGHALLLHGGQIATRTVAGNIERLTTIQHPADAWLATGMD